MPAESSELYLLKQTKQEAEIQRVKHVAVAIYQPPGCRNSALDFAGIAVALGL